MSFVNWLKGKHKHHVSSASAQTDQKQSKTSKIQSAIKALGDKINIFQQQQTKLNNVIKLKKAKAKKILAEGDQAKARQSAIIAVTFLQELEICSLRKKCLAEKMFHLQQALMDIETIESLKSCSSNVSDKEEQAHSQDATFWSSSKTVESEILKLENQERDAFEEEVNKLLIELANEINKEKEQNDEFLKQLASL